MKGMQLSQTILNQDRHTFDQATIRTHVQLLHKAAKGCDGKFVISVFNGNSKGTITHHQVGDVDGMVSAIIAHEETPGANVYCGLHLMRHELPRGQRGSKGDIVAVLGLIADMDSDTGKVGEMPIEPSYVVETSPGNAQPAILFDEPISPEDAQPLAKALQKATGSDYGTGDIAHVWRIPGTLNFPNGAKIARGRDPRPAIVSILAPFSGKRHGPKALAAILEPFTGRDEPALSEGKFDGKVDTAPLWTNMDHGTRALIKADGQPDRSTHAARVTAHLKSTGYSINQAISLCLERPGTWTDRYKDEARLVQDLERCWNKFTANGDLPLGQPTHADDNHSTPVVAQERAIVATPFKYRDPSKIPPRQALYAGHFSRGFVSLTLGMGGGGKSNLEIVDALSMMSSKPLLGHVAEIALRVWYINLEDPVVESERRFVAAALHHKVDPSVLEDNLFLDSGRDQEFVVLKNSQRSTQVMESVVKGIIQQMRERSIDVLIVDPFISTHEVDENDNSKIQQVAGVFVRIANETNAAVEIVHHVRKGLGQAKNSEITADSGRGAGALKDKARSVRVINGMTKKEATKAGIPEENRFDYFRINQGKSNLTRRTDNAEWRKMISVNLGNGANFWEGGDSVGVVTEWKWPSVESATQAIDPDDLRAIKLRIAEGNYRSNVQAKDWVGKPIAEILDLDLGNDDDKAEVKLIAKGLLADGHLKEVTRRCPEKREDKSFIEVGQVPHPAQGGAGVVLH